MRRVFLVCRRQCTLCRRQWFKNRKDYRRVCDSLPSPIISNRYVCSFTGCCGASVVLPSAPSLVQQFAAKGSSFQRRVLSLALFSTFLFSCYPSVFNLSLRLSFRPLLVYMVLFTFLYLYRFALSLSFCLETLLCGLLLSCSRPRCRVILNLYLVTIPLRGEVFYLNLFLIPSLSTIFTFECAIPMIVILVSFSFCGAGLCLAPEIFLLRAVLANLMFSY